MESASESQSADAEAQGRRLEELLRADATYRTLIEQIPAITYTELEADDPSAAQAVFISPQISGVLGRPAGDFNTLAGWSDAIHPEDRARVLAEADRTGKSGEPFRIEYRVLTSDGGVVWIRDHAVLTTDPVTGARQWQGVMLDITTEKEAQEALERAMAERGSLLHQTVRAAEDERARLSAELHDGSVQRLTGLMIRLAALRSKAENLPASRHDVLLEQLRRFEDDLGGEVGHLRNMMVELRPTALDQWGLETALREHADELNDEPGPIFRTNVGECGDLPPEVETIFYRIAQEALANVLRHSHASQAQLTLRRERDELVMTVTDDGIGFDLADTPGLHFGLLSMRERAEMLRGRCEIRSATGAGTTVKVTVPLKPQKIGTACA